MQPRARNSAPVAEDLDDIDMDEVMRERKEAQANSKPWAPTEGGNGNEEDEFNTQLGTLPARMAPIFGKSISLALGRKPEVGDVELLDKSTLGPRERYAEESARRSVQADSATQKAKLASRATSIEDLARMYQVADTRKNRANMEIGRAADEYNRQHAADERRMANQYDVYNANAKTVHSAEVADSKNAYRDWKRGMRSGIAGDIAGLGQEAFNAATSKDYVDSTNNAMMLAAIQQGYSVNEIRGDARRAKKTNADYKAKHNSNKSKKKDGK